MLAMQGQDQVAEGSAGCSKEHSVNSTSEPQLFLIPKISFSLQPLEVGLLPQAPAYRPQNSATAWTTSALHSAPNHPNKGGSQLWEG